MSAGGRRVPKLQTYLNRLLHPISQPIGPTGLVTAVKRRTSSRRHRASAGGRNTYQPSLTLHLITPLGSEAGRNQTYRGVLG